MLNFLPYLWGQEATPTPAALPPLPPMELTTLPEDPGFSFLKILLIAVQILVCLGLVGCVLSQTTKSEGLGGSIMGPSQSVFKGKKSSDEKLSTVTRFLAIAFIVLSVAVSYVFHR
ncbi:MAG: preprotein translocase subunit SecG [Candidatus Eremiobacterota bacterium]